MCDEKKTVSIEDTNPTDDPLPMENLLEKWNELKLKQDEESGEDDTTDKWEVMFYLVKSHQLLCKAYLELLEDE
jgi:hypothetical protein